MDKSEAVNYALACGSENPQNTAEYLVDTFPKSISEYTRDDFLDSNVPYDYIWLYNSDKFTQDKLIVKMAAQARSCGVSNFVTLYKSYIKTQHKDECDNLGEVTNFPNQPLNLRCGKWQCDINGVRFSSENNVIFACPHPIMPVARLVNIDTGIEKVKIAYCRGKLWKTAIFDRKTISSANKIIDLADCGIAVTSENARYLVQYFYDVEKENPDLISEIECVTHLGWIDRGDGLEFIPFADGVQFDGEAEYKSRFDAVKTHGNLEKWVEFIEKNIRKNKQIIARITFSAALASVLVKPLHCNNFWLHLWGESESAKTVMMMCAASIWGNPTIGKFITTFNSTYVGNEKSAALCGSIPYMLDELQIAGKRDMEQLIYMLMEGVGRSRGNKSGGLDTVARWRNCTISTGEKPINADSAGGGAVNRVIECECRDYFFDEPRKVAAFVQNNYGFFGKAFIEYLLRDGVLERAENMLEQYSKELTERKITQKQAQSAALILVADALAVEIVFDDNTRLTVDEIAEFLKTKDEVSANPRAYEYICEQVAANQLHFIQNADRPVEMWGALDGDNAVYIIKSVFSRMCDEGGYNAVPLLSWLAAKGLIERSSGKNTVPKRIGGVLTRCVHITMNCAGNDCENSINDYPDF